MFSNPPIRDLPEIRISFAYLLYSSESAILAKHYGKPLNDASFYKEKTREYKAEWKKEENRILTSLTDALEVNFHTTTIDVALAPFFHSKSRPLIMNFKYTPDHFVDALTHELAHILLVDSDAYQAISSDIDIVGRWQKLFGIRQNIETIHIAVHALLKFIYLDVLDDPARLERDIATCAAYPPYMKAWKYVNDNDYRKIIEQLKQIYIEVQ